jgi:3',5'-cyclic AMP phosphodiesterase CpdA
MLTRRTVLAGIGGGGLAALAGAGPLASPSAVAGARASVGSPLFTFVSMPDFMNGDVADLSVLPTWDGGLNSVNQSWQTAIDTCLGAVAAHEPDAVFVAGDLVEGHWNIDSDGRQLFGPVSQGIDPESIAQCQSAIDVAGDLHYSTYADLFASRGLILYPALGDHEILDDRRAPLNERWSPSGQTRGVPDNRYYLVDHSKEVWARHFTRPGGVNRFVRRPYGSAAEGTAYAVSFADSLTLITVDMFTRRSSGVHLGVFEGQLTWLKNEIRAAKKKGHFVVVQGHVPVMSPYRWLASGRLQLPERRDSTFYRALDREGADLYLCGEVHDSTVIQHGPHAPVQISHGCVFQLAFSYLVGRLYEDGRLVLDLYEMPIERASIERGLWASDSRKRQRTFIEYGAPRHRGRLVQRGRTIVSRTAKLARYHPDDDAYALAGHLPTVLV